MTVRELIEALGRCPQNAVVLVGLSPEGGNYASYPASPTFRPDDALYPTPTIVIEGDDTSWPWVTPERT